MVTGIKEAVVKGFRKELQEGFEICLFNSEREKFMLTNNELTSKRRRILLVNDIFDHEIGLVELSLDVCLFFDVACNDKQPLNSLPKTDSLPFQLLK